MASLLCLPHHNAKWHRWELPPEGSSLLRMTGDCTLDLTIVGDPLESKDHPHALAVFSAWSQHGRLHHLHLNLVDETYRNAELLALAGMTVLRDRDCLQYRVDGTVQRIFYDAFSPPQIRSYAGGPLDCAYCRQPVDSGSSVVECPGCGIVFHQSQAAGCWLVSDRCLNCGHPTSLEQVSDWIPQGFEYLTLEMNDDHV